MPEETTNKEGARLIRHTHRELVEMLIKANDIHEGKWSLLIEFGLAISNAGLPGDICPSALVAVSKIGLQPALKGLPPENSITVDAAKVNPKTPKLKAPKIPEPPVLKRKIKL